MLRLLKFLSIVFIIFFIGIGFIALEQNDFAPTHKFVPMPDLKYMPAFIVFTASPVLIKKRRWLLVSGFILAILDCTMISCLRTYFPPTFGIALFISTIWFLVHLKK